MNEKIFEDLYLVTESPYLIQDKIKKHAADTLPKFLLGICFLMIIENWLPYLFSLAFPTTVADVIAHYNSNIDAQMLQALPKIPVFLYIYALIFNGVIKLGEALFTLTYIRNRTLEFKALFEGIKFYFKAFILYLIQIIIISFWSMFFLIPGIIAALNFSQSFYLLADDPSKTIINLLLESKIRMKGNRLTYLKLIVSYLPYILLGLIPSLAIDFIVEVDITTMKGLGIDLLVNTPFYIAMAYLMIGQCVFYELLISKGFSNFRYKGQDAFRDELI